jgi:hypothetical protein
MRRQILESFPTEIVTNVILAPERPVKSSNPKALKPTSQTIRSRGVRAAMLLLLDFVFQGGDFVDAAGVPAAFKFGCQP